MASWKEFAQQAPELAAFGEARFRNGVAYLGTLRADGSPRVHPVTPIIGEQWLIVHWARTGIPVLASVGSWICRQHRYS